VTQVVETPLARALSRDGVSWQVQVLAERPEHTWGSLNRGTPFKQFFRFGMWDPTAGMSRVPVNPILDVGAMLAAANQLTDRLRSVVNDVPYPLIDRFERWLLDAHDQPVALLGATTDPRFLGEITDTDWQATLPAGATFRSPHLEAQGVPVCVGRSRRHHAERLEWQVNGRAGKPPRVQWFERRADGSRAAVDAVPGAVGAKTANATFPAIGLSLDWPDPDQLQLAWDYLAWNAPRFLTLPDMPDSLRHRLEEAAKRNAMLVEAQHRLYPRVLNPSWIDAARVEARLRAAASVATD
jgi:hypothetical protein